MKIDILFENEQVMVVNKPTGMVVNRADSVAGETVQDWAEKRFKIQDLRFKNNSQIEETFRQRSGIAHRLDRETSGCLVLAKTPEALTDLMKQFYDRTVHKTYIALVHGRVEPERGAWRLPIGRRGENRHLFAVDVWGKDSVTAYKVAGYFWHEKTPLSLLTLFPKTGRTHQIRVHMEFLKHPLVADDKYGGKRALADLDWCPRLFLHAAQIDFKQPSNRKRIEVEAPLPVDLQTVIDSLDAYD